MTNKKNKKRTERAKAVTKADSAVSLYIREKTRQAYGVCPFCGKEIQCCFHWVTRGKYSTRWDEDNVLGTCMGCNLDYEHNPHPYISWFIDNYGLDNYDQLIVKSNKIIKYDIFDLEEIILNYSNKLKELNETR